MRNFETGATRDTVEGKPQYEAYTSPLVTHAFGQYMLSHQTQADGKHRNGDNWQKGMPIPAYADSLDRHHMDVKLIHRGLADLATTPDIVEALCAMRFNVDGLLFEILMARREAEGLPTPRPGEVSSRPIWADLEAEVNASEKL